MTATSIKPEVQAISPLYEPAQVKLVSALARQVSLAVERYGQPVFFPDAGRTEQELVPVKPPA